MPRQLERLHDAVMRVSDPTSPDYGAFLTQQQLREIVAPSTRAKDAVVRWLRVHGASSIAPNAYGDIISFDLSVGSIETMLKTRLFMYAHRQRHVQQIVRAGMWSDRLSVACGCFAFSAVSVDTHNLGHIAEGRPKTKTQKNNRNS
jgi:hypothetical protein